MDVTHWYSTFRFRRLKPAATKTGILTHSHRGEGNMTPTFREGGSFILRIKAFILDTFYRRNIYGIFDLWKFAHNHFDPTFHPDAKTVVKLKGAGSPKLGEYRPNP
jgi:hypothetical protein